MVSRILFLYYKLSPWRWPKYEICSRKSRIVSRMLAKAAGVAESTELQPNSHEFSNAASGLGEVADL